MEIIKVNGNEIGTFDGFVRILWGNKGKTLCLTAMGKKRDKFISLNDCLKEIEYDGKGTVIVIIEHFLYGYIYKYGNYGNDWYKYGETRGFA